jgi:hypothetical protein
VSNFGVKHLQALQAMGSGVEMPAVNQFEMHPLILRVKSHAHLHPHDQAALHSLTVICLCLAVLALAVASAIRRSALRLWTTAMRTASASRPTAPSSTASATSWMTRRCGYAPPPAHTNWRVAQVGAIAAAHGHGTTNAQVLLRWALQRGFAVIPKVCMRRIRETTAWWSLCRRRHSCAREGSSYCDIVTVCPASPPPPLPHPPRRTPKAVSSKARQEENFNVHGFELSAAEMEALDAMTGEPLAAYWNPVEQAEVDMGDADLAVSEL